MSIEKIEYEAYHCTKCGEEILTMDQMKELGKKYRQLRKTKETKFAQWGNSIAIRIPKEFTKELKIKVGTKAHITKEQGILKIILA